MSISPPTAPLPTLPTSPRAIRTSARNAFAHHSMRVRVPGILRSVSEKNPSYAPLIHEAIARLRADIEADAPLTVLEPPGPDVDDWAAAVAAHEDDSWLSTDWFFAEALVYRALLSATRYFETGQDPFAPDKAEELSGATLWQQVEAALALEDKQLWGRLDLLMRQAMWGNRIDLSYAAAAAHGATSDAASLLVDDGAHAIEHLLRTPGPVHLIADNAGTELALDLCLIDALLSGAAPLVTLHVKMWPTFVSDATVHDVQSMLRAFCSAERPAATRAAGQRLQRAFDAQRLQVHPDSYWNSWRFFWDMPARVERALRSATLCIIKGDANYRRLLGDAIWPADHPLAPIVSYFPAPLVALRTLKSDPIVGLPRGLAEQLEKQDAKWRVDGRRGIVQAALGR